MAAGQDPFTTPIYAEIKESSGSMALDQPAKARFAGIQRSHLEQMAKLVDQYLLVHFVEPRLDLREQRGVGFFRQIALVLGNGNIQGELLGQGQVDGKERTNFVPLLLARHRKRSGLGRT